MTHGELWREIMWYGKFDRMPVIHWGGWPETHERWLKEGLPPDVSERNYFQATPHWMFISVNINLYPEFEEEVLEINGEYRVVRSKDGVVKQEWLRQSCIPHYMDFTLKTASDWEKYKTRLKPDQARIPENLDEKINQAEESGLFMAVETVSLMGWIRNWMGVENMSYLMYDNPEVYEDMVNTLADLSCWAIDQIVPRMKRKPDMGFGWEDICGKSGPLVNPDFFVRYVAPGYQKIRNKLEQYGVKLLGIDCDGDVEKLVEPWLDSGVNLFFPIEKGTWQADPMLYRKKYGREMRIVGGFNKHELEKSPAAIDVEIERRLPLMKAGGFVMMPDHLITPDTPLENYKYYINRIRTLRF